ncbi:hypothetical protein DFP72DRAFT_845829 [Ephemerocybe angulata]|uniref:Uncharacterized protein n=1 Tax=Ephemerocybe angulata TaxID=980116 RepID=A0A8H6I4U9_9AGAR|nr:hypothetical protein DFP72DRAFT_845829 [Tulosesus angulatus]
MDDCVEMALPDSTGDVMAPASHPLGMNETESEGRRLYLSSTGVMEGGWQWLLLFTCPSTVRTKHVLQVDRIMERSAQEGIPNNHPSSSFEESKDNETLTNHYIRTYIAQIQLDFGPPQRRGEEQLIMTGEPFIVGVAGTTMRRKVFTWMVGWADAWMSVSWAQGNHLKNLNLTTGWVITEHVKCRPRGHLVWCNDYRALFALSALSTAAHYTCPYCPTNSEPMLPPEHPGVNIERIIASIFSDDATKKAINALKGAPSRLLSPNEWRARASNTIPFGDVPLE